MCVQIFLVIHVLSLSILLKKGARTNMSLSPVEAIAYLQQFLNDPSSPRFYVFPSSADLNADAEATNFMESCWRSATCDEGVQHMTPLPSPVAKTPRLTSVSIPNVSKETDMLANIVHYDVPPLGSPKTGAVGSFFTSAVLPTNAKTDSRCGRNGVAWVVL